MWKKKVYRHNYKGIIICIRVIVFLLIMPIESAYASEPGPKQEQRPDAMLKSAEIDIENINDIEAYHKRLIDLRNDFLENEGYRAVEEGPKDNEKGDAKKQ